MKRKQTLLSLIFILLPFLLIGQVNPWMAFPSGSLGFSSIRKINILDNGDVWIGTRNNGAFKFSNNVWTQFNTTNSGLADDDVRDIAMDSNGKIWMTTWNKLSVLSTNNTWQTYNITGNYHDVLYSVEIDSNNKVWIGTDGGANPQDGLYLWNTSSHYTTSNSPLTSNWIIALEKDHNGAIWACAKDIIKIVDTTMTSITTSTMGFTSSNVYSMAIDFNSNNHIWVGVYNGGVSYYNGNQWVIYNAANSPLPENKIWSITVDKYDNVWIGTEHDGLVKFDGQNWTIYNTTNSPLTNNRIDALNSDYMGNIWIGATNNGLLLFNEDGFSSVYGKVFLDANADHTYQTGEKGIPNCVVRLSPKNYYGVTDSLGNYNISTIDTGGYFAHCIVNNAYTTNIYPDSTAVTMRLSIIKDQANFAVQMASNKEDISISATPLNQALLGHSLHYKIRIENRGSILSDSIGVSFNPDINLILDSISANYFITGNIIYWGAGSLKLGQYKDFDLYFSVPSNSSLIGQTLESYTKVQISNDNLLQNNFDTIRQTVSNFYPSYSKTVKPKGDSTIGYINLGTPNLDYTIQFQNTSNDTFHKIIIIDTLSPLLDITSIQTTQSSHNYSFELKKEGVAIWTFYKINLPDSNTNYLKSNGFIRFIITPKDNVKKGDVIENRAALYIDNRPAAWTNTTINTYTAYHVSVEQIEKEAVQISIYPNPSSGMLNLSINDKSLFPLRLEIYNMEGKLIHTENNIQVDNQKIWINKISSGVYIYRIYKHSDYRIGEGKLVIKNF